MEIICLCFGAHYNHLQLGASYGSMGNGNNGALRSRAGITGGISTLPTSVDPYLQSTYFPNIPDPVILEVRRERVIELVLEGFRFYDLVRWKRSALTVERAKRKDYV